MNKNFWQSKTMWGFGLAILIGAFQGFGVIPDANIIANSAQVVATLVGMWGGYSVIARIARK